MAFFSKSLRNWTKKHDFIEGLTEWSPTEYAELKEFITEYTPTEYAECTKFIAEFFPTEYAELTEFTAEYSPTEYAECTKFTAEFFPTEYAELTEFTAEYSPTDFRCNFRGCTCLKCTNQANSDPPTDFTLHSTSAGDDLPQISQKYTDC